MRVLLVLVGIFLGQVILYGPSLAGTRLLVPLGLLKGHALPDTDEYADVHVQPPVFLDQVTFFEWERRFAAEEYRQGRIPLWSPYSFAGSPSARWAKYSPFNALYFAFPRPETLAWMQLLKSLTAGLGAYLVFRVVLGTHFWPATVGAWCYPLTTFFALWQGYPISSTIAFFPWSLLAVDRVVRCESRMLLTALALVTGLTIVSGQADMAGQVLIVSGIFALASLWSQFGREVLSKKALRPVMTLVGGWTLGLGLSAPYTLPLIEYAGTGIRMEERLEGIEERPTGDSRDLTLVLFPEAHGSSRSGSLYIKPGGIRLESAAGAHVGLIATLVFAPFAFTCRKRRFLASVFLGIALLGLAWVLEIPGVVEILRLPGLNLMSHNRFVFATGFALLGLAVLGLDTLTQAKQVPRRWWLALPVAGCLVSLLWCASRAISPPEPIATALAASVKAGHPPPWVPTLEAVQSVAINFRQVNLIGATLCVVALLGWFLLFRARSKTLALVRTGSAVMVLELLYWGYGINAQTDPRLYFPTLSALEGLADKQPKGRSLAVGCLPPRTYERFRLREVRGYDGVDPARLVEILDPVRHPKSQSPRNARLQKFFPQFQAWDDGHVDLPPVLDMLAVRWIIFKFKELPLGLKPVVAAEGYSVLENKNALHRAFVPRSARLVGDDRERIALITDPNFRPLEVAFVESGVNLSAPIKGEARIVREIPTEVILEADMATPGLVVLADLWDRGWEARLDGEPVPILRTNHAIRGVVVPGGKHELIFRYRPGSLRLGIGLMLAAVLGLVVLEWPEPGPSRRGHLCRGGCGCPLCQDDPVDSRGSRGIS